jgi:hypothetical protein
MDGTKVDSDKDEVVSGYVPEDLTDATCPLSPSINCTETDCIQMFCRERAKRQKRTIAKATEVCTVEDIKALASCQTQVKRVTWG